MSKRIKKPAEEEIDKIAVAQANNNSAWEKPVQVRHRRSAAVPLSSELAARAAFFARLHHETSVEDWIKRVVLERLNLEEAVFAELKRELTAK